MNCNIYSYLQVNIKQYFRRTNQAIASSKAKLMTKVSDLTTKRYFFILSIS